MTRRFSYMKGEMILFKIFGYLKNSKAVVFAIVCLLILQAACDLSLPKYTADIVDVGIQQGGIDSAAPTRARGETLASLKLFMTDAEAAAVDAAYTQDGGEYKLTATGKDEIAALEESFAVPMVILSNIGEYAPVDASSLASMYEAGLITDEQLNGIRSGADEMIGGLSESIIDQMAVAFVKAEYEALGMDMAALQRSYLFTTGFKMLGLSLVIMCSAILVGLLASRTAAKIGRELRGGVFKKVVSFSSSEMDNFSTASLITRSTNDIQQIQQVLVMILRMVLYSPILGIGGIIRVATTRTGMSWIIFVAVASILILVSTLMRVAMPKFKLMQTLIDKINLISREILTGIPVIRAFSRERHEEERFDGANIELTKTQLFTNRTMAFMMPIMTIIMNGFSILIVWVGSKGVDMGNLQVGDMMAFMTYTMQIVMSFMMLTMISIMLPRAGVAAERINEVLSTEATILDGGDAPKHEGAEFSGEVTFEDVSFRYPDAEDDVIEHVTFTAIPGETTAIIGSTGSGKSTLLNLIPRFFDVTSGRVTMDGVDIRDMSQKKLRSLLGYIPQKGILFSGDIESNIKFDGDYISDEMMEQAARIAQAADFIGEKDDGYKSSISQGGSNVSGGQKQRLSIARAVAKDPKVFLFDDSFSALDYKTDVALRKALAENIHGATIIIVAQRISTVLHADRIVVLDEGKVAGIGRHEELMESCPTYAEIARSQLSESELSGGMGA